MFGWRAKIGLLIPAQNTTMEEEFHRMAPEGVSIHTSRIPYSKPELTIETLTEISTGSVDAARRVAMVKPDIIVFGGTAGSLVEKAGYDKEVIEKIEEATEISATTSSIAALQAFKTLNLSKVAVAAPYTTQANARVKRFLENNGYTVTKIKGLERFGMNLIGREPPSTAYRLAKEVHTPEADGVFISCTDFRSIEILERLEQDLGKPVVSSNQASMWAALRKVGINKHLEGYGLLLRQS
ncbi:MAG: aspartate/glutamate racemase family protein [Candidatus Bathyarchaeia archaeon]